MEDAKAAVGSADLKTGVRTDGDTVLKSVMFRELAGPEEDILASSSMPVGQKITNILSNCTVDFGGVKDPSEIRKLIEKLVVTDRWFYLVELRSLSLGSAYKTLAKCPECGKEDKVVIDLRELEVTNPPKANELFKETALPSGHKVRWKVLDGASELKIEKMAKSDNKATVGLFARCTEFDGKPVTYVDIKNLSMKDRKVLRDDIDAGEGDFDETYTAQCPECGNEYEGQVKLDPENFFFP